MPRALVPSGAAVAAVLALLATSVAGCTVPDGVGVAGFAEPEVVLRLGVADSAGRYSHDVSLEFARRVELRTNGTVRVEVVDADTRTPRFHQVLADRVTTGDLDLALAQAQTWDTRGVTSLTALYVPFLVPDEEVLDAVALDDVLADDLMAGLRGTGVTGLALVPGGLRRVFAEDEALLRPGDLAGRRTRVGWSTTTWAVLEALGAEPADVNGENVARQIRNGSIRAFDSTFALADAFYDAPVAPGDVSPYPLAFTLVANDDALAELADRDRAALEQAARDTVEWAASTRPSEADDARALCTRNPRAQVVVAGEEALEEWVEATRPLAARLRQDPAVDRLADRIEGLAAGVQPRADPVRPCRGPAAAPTPAAGETPANEPATFPEGTYRKSVTVDHLVERGVNRSDAESNAGLFTLDLRDGRLDDPGCPGSTYVIRDDRLVITLGPEGPTCGTAAGLVLFSAGWRLQGSLMTFTDVRSGHGSETLIPALFGGAPWTKIG